MQMINTPMFLISNIEVNEYTLRQYMVDVAKGLELPCEVKDLQTNQVANILEDGSLDENLDSLYINTDYKYELLKLKNNLTL